MRNYFEVLGINRSASSNDIKQAVDALSAEQLAEEGDISSVLLNDQRLMHYRRVHLQYEAIAAVINSPEMDGVQTSHSWDKRVVEFNPAQGAVVF